MFELTPIEETRAGKEILDKGREGRKEGRDEGREESQRAMVRNMVENGMTPEEIARVSGLKLEIVRGLTK